MLRRWSVITLALLVSLAACAVPSGMTGSPQGVVLNFVLSHPSADQGRSRLLLANAKTIKVTVSRDGKVIDSKTLSMASGKASYQLEFEALVPHLVEAQALDAAGLAVYSGSFTLALFADNRVTLYLLPVKADGSSWPRVSAEDQTAGVLPTQPTPALGASQSFRIDFGNTGTKFQFQQPGAGLQLYLQALSGEALTLPADRTIALGHLSGESSFWATYYQTDTTEAAKVGSVGSFTIPLKTLQLPTTYELTQSGTADLGSLLVRTPANTTDVLQWSVDQSLVASIDATTGLLTALTPAPTPASATVTVRSASNAAVSASLALKVYGPEYSSLSALGLSVDGTSLPLAFLPATTSYSPATVGSQATTQTLGVTATEGLAGQTLSWSWDGVTWSPLTTGTQTNLVLVQGSQQLRVKVLALNGNDTKTYLLNLVKKVWPATVTMTPSSLTIATAKIGAKFTATAGPSIADDLTLTWSSSNTAVATVDAATGVITPVAAGSAAIRATSVADPTVFASSPLTVEAMTVAITPASLTITTATVGAKFTSTAGPSYADDLTVKWTSSNAGVATVDASTGVITPVAAGSVTITATSVAAPSVSASSTLVVENVSPLIVNLSTPSFGTLVLSPSTISVTKGSHKVITLTGSLATTGSNWRWTAGGTVLSFVQTGTSFDLDTSALARGSFDLTLEAEGPGSILYSGSAVLEVTP